MPEGGIAQAREHLVVRRLALLLFLQACFLLPEVQRFDDHGLAGGFGHPDDLDGQCLHGGGVRLRHLELGAGADQYAPALVIAQEAIAQRLAAWCEEGVFCNDLVIPAKRNGLELDQLLVDGGLLAANTGHPYSIRMAAPETTV